MAACFNTHPRPWFYEKVKFSVKWKWIYPYNAPIYIDVYYTKLKPIKKVVEKWTVIDEIKLPTAFYKTPTDLALALNKQGPNTLHKYKFTFNVNTERFHIDLDETTVVKISEKLAKLLGFNQTFFCHEKTEAAHPSDLLRCHHHFYLYCNIIRPRYVGGVQVPLLRMIPVKKAGYGESVSIEFQHLEYIPVDVHTLSKVELTLTDSINQRIPFDGGTSIATLHFRKRTPY